MEWYYVREGDRVGPVSDADLPNLVGDGTISDDTLVWHEGMQDWLPYAQAGAAAPAPGVPAPAAAGTDAPAAREVCAECGGTFSTNDMIHHGDSWVCAACKPTFLQKLKEGAPLAGTFQYAGFWIRAGAKIVDWIVLWPISFAVGIVGSALGSTSDAPEAMILVQGIVMILNLAIPVCYTTWMVGRWGATLGKMACGIKIILPDGGRVSYPRALGRYFAEMLSGMIFGIGYIIAAFDDEKRTLHDRICNTRVVRK